MSKPQPSTRSTLDKNLNANASSIKPNKTFTELVQDPDFGSLVTILGKMANKVNGNERANPKPNIPYVRSIEPPSPEILPTNNVPRIGPVQEKETNTRVKDMKKVDNNPFEIFDFESALFTQELGREISNKPNSDKEKTIKIIKNKKFKTGLVEI